MAVEMRNGKKVLITPVSAEDLKDIHIGDIVYLTGDITTCRDVAHRRVVEEGREIPVDVRDAAILHAGPIIRPLGDDKYEMVSVGPTTSMRMENGYRMIHSAKFPRSWTTVRISLTVWMFMCREICLTAALRTTRTASMVTISNWIWQLCRIPMR